MAAGVEKNIEIKKNSRGFEFGLTGGGGTGESQKEYQATMFNAQEVANGKLIKVWRESGAEKASIVLTDGTEHQLINTRTVKYREADRINRKTGINWALDFFASVSGIECCQHEEEGKFLNQHLINVTNIHGNVETLGSIGGQNNENKIDSIKEKRPL